VKNIVSIIVASLSLLFCQTVIAQSDVQNMYAAGMAYSVNGAPPLASEAIYAHRMNDAGTYGFTNIIALPNTVKPFTVTSNVGVGVAQKVATIANIPVYAPVGIGPSWTGSNIGYQYNAGFLASIHIKNDYYFLPSFRFVKSSVSNGTGYQPTIGLDFGWGK
jgi:hypothetical protein